MPRKVIQVDEKQFKLDWAAGIPLMDLSVKYEISRDAVTAVRDRLGLPKRYDRKLRHKPKRRPDPSPAAIEQSCKEIRAKWDEKTEVDRRGYKAIEWQIPQYDFEIEDLRLEDPDEQ